MTQTFDLIIQGGQVALFGETHKVDIGVIDGKTAAIGSLDASLAHEVIDASGLTVLPGVIDTQVHFREPGNTHKEDLESGSRAAVMGGVTAVFEMPNTNPLTDTPEALADKLNRAMGMWCDHAFYVGATAENARKMGELERLAGCCGVKIFMGASTGDLLVEDDETLFEVLRHGHRRVAIHAEDEYRMRAREGERVEGRPHSHPEWRDAQTAILATKRALAAARKAGRKVHILHVTTADEMRLLANNKDIASVEATPQHLTLAAPDCYDRLGTFAQMNPPIRDQHHRDGLWWGISNGVVDVIGSDHAPHTREEKAGTYPNTPSGMPGVQTLLPLLLTHMAHGRLSLGQLVDLTSAGALRLFGLRDKGRIAVGYDADYTVVDLNARWRIEEDWIESKCGWSPFTGDEMVGKPVATIIRGRAVMRDGELLGTPSGAPLRFIDTIQPQ